MKILLEIQKYKKLFWGLSCEDFNNWQSLLLQCFSELYWNRFTFRVMFWKGSHRSLTAVKNFKRAQHYYNHYKSVPSGIHVSVSTAQLRIFLIARVIMHFENTLQKCFNFSYYKRHQKYVKSRRSGVLIFNFVHGTS